MRHLQAALDQRLAELEHKKSSPQKRADETAKIKKTLKQAGIINAQGKMIQHVTS